MIRAAIPAAILLSILAASGPAIIRRDDVPDARYLARGARYVMTVADIAVPDKDGRLLRGNGIGTLVDPDWILTRRTPPRLAPTTGPAARPSRGRMPRGGESMPG